MNYQISYEDNCPDGCRLATRKELKKFSLTTTIGGTKQKTPLHIATKAGNQILYRKTLQMIIFWLKKVRDGKLPQDMAYLFVELG